MKFLTEKSCLYYPAYSMLKRITVKHQYPLKS